MYRRGWAAQGGQIQKCSRRWAGRSAKRRRSARCDRQAAGGPRAGAGPAWRRYSAGVALDCAKELALSPGGSAEGPAAKGTAPPRHSTQCQPTWGASAGGAVFWSAGACTPSAEQIWCNGASSGSAAKAGVITAAASDSAHQATTPTIKARARRRWWNSEGVGDMLVRRSAAILLR
jgi:hypothetical protein